MREQVIHAIELRRYSTFTPSPDYFTFRRECLHKWLQRVCFWILRRIGCFVMDESVRVERYIIDGDTFIDRALKQHEALATLLMREPKKILIGAEDYHDLMLEGKVSNIAFNFQTKYEKNYELFGMTVHVIPWMRGLLVMP